MLQRCWASKMTRTRRPCSSFLLSAAFLVISIVVLCSSLLNVAASAAARPGPPTATRHSRANLLRIQDAARRGPQVQPPPRTGQASAGLLLHRGRGRRAGSEAAGPGGLGRAPPDAVVLVTILLHHGDEASRRQLEEHFWAVSDPGSPRRGEYLSTSDVAALLAARPEAVTAVRAWLSSAGVPESSVLASPWGDHLFVNTTTRSAEVLLGEELVLHPRGGRSGSQSIVARSAVLGGGVALPPDHPVAEHVHRVTVAGTVAVEEHRTERELQTTAVPYPFTFYPPSLFSAVVALPAEFTSTNQGTVVVQFIMTCPDDPWPSLEIPLRGLNVPSGPGSDPFAPCATTSGESSRPTSFVVSLTPTTSSRPLTQRLQFQIATKPTQNGCAEVHYTMPQGASAEVAWTAAECQYSFTGLSLLEDVQYSVSLKYEYPSGVTSEGTFHATPSGSVLHVQQMQVKEPSDLSEEYGVPDGAVTCDNSTQQGVMVLQEPGEGFYNDDDVSGFLYNIGMPPELLQSIEWMGTLEATPSLRAFLNASGLAGPLEVQRDQSNPGGETTLDVEWIVAMAAGARTTVWHGGYFRISSGELVDPLYSTLLAVQYAPQPPQVISISYGGVEPGKDAVSLGNQFFQALGALGVTVVVSSGDTGPYLASGDVAFSCSQFLPSWPATSPYVLSVGATMKGTVSGTVGQLPASIAYGAGITTGGGFSAVNPRPDYQRDAVEQYLATADLPTDVSFHREGRGYPDVSLYGHSFLIVINGALEPVDGTSASAPSLAGMLSLMNDGLKRLGAPTLGFINPTLYKMAADRPEAFIDITFGDNKCMGQSSPNACCDDGFVAAEGWDPTTGLGSLRFAEAFAYIASGLTATTVSSFPDTPENCSLAKTACSYNCTLTCDLHGTCATEATWSWILTLGLGIAGGIVAFALYVCLCQKVKRPRTPRVEDNQRYAALVEADEQQD